MAHLGETRCDLAETCFESREVRYATCSADKARRLLDYKTTVPLRDGLQSIVDWVSAHGTKPFAYHLPIEIESPLVPETWTARLL